MNVALSASRVALRYASLRRAGLFDRDLVTKTVQYVLRGGTHKDGVPAFEDVGRTHTGTRDESTEYEWEDAEGDNINVNVDVTVPVKAMVYMDFVLPAKLVLQVPTAQREEFMLEVLNLVARKLKPYGVVQGVMGGTNGLQQLLKDYNDDNLDFTVDGVLNSARMSAPEQAGRFVLRGNEARFPVKFNATYELSWSWGDNTNAEAYLPEPSFDDFDPSDFDPSEADRAADRYFSDRY